MAKIEVGAKISKNARQSGIRTDKFTHICGGNITMKMVFKQGKLLTQAVCSGCNMTAKKPSDMELLKNTKVLRSEVPV